MTAPYWSSDDGRIVLYHGDCRDVTEWLAADVLVTDPPYGIGWRRGENRARSSRRHVGIVNDQDTTMRDVALTLFAARPAVVFGSLAAGFPAGTRQVLIWHKPPDAGVVGSTTGWRRDAEAIFLVGPWPTRTVRASSVLRSRITNIGSPSSPAGRTRHPHTKPVDLMAELIGGCPPGTVADPFAGSGSTLVAAQLLGRPAIGVEIEERYCEVAARRLSQGVIDFDGATS
jgi:site-specific DNA-methyltransferase (adenine-specific)